MTRDAIDNYGEQYRDVPFKIIHRATSEEEHPGYDSGLAGMGLYDLRFN